MHSPLAGASIEAVLAVTTDRATQERAVLSARTGAAGQLGIYFTVGQGVAGATAPTMRRSAAGH